MAIHQHATIGDTVYFWFGSNDTSGSGNDGASAAADVRLAGALASAAPVLSPTPDLLSHASYPAGAYEVAVAATVGNGFAAGNTYAVFCTLTVDSQNPTGFVGSFTLTPLATQASVNTIDDFLDTEIAAILADTGELQTDWADGGRLDLILDARASQASVDTVDGIVDAILVDTGTTLEVDLDAIIAAVITNAAGVDIAADIIAVKADTAAILTDTGTTLDGKADQIIAATITNAAGVDIAADIIAIKAETATILADTNELQTDDYPTSIAAVKADTAAILVDTGTTLDAALAVVDANVDAILVDTSTTLDDLVDDLESRLGIPSNLGSGATIAANLVDIEAQTDDIGVAGAGLTNINLPDQTMNITGDITGNLSGSVGSVTGAAGSVTGNVGGNVTGSVGSLATQAKADVNAEIVDALATDTYAEPGQGAPAATASLAAKINYLYKSWRNKKTQTSTTRSIYNDAGDTVDQKATDSDDGTTFTKGELGTGP